MGVKIAYSNATHLDMIEARDLGLGWDGWSNARLYYLPILGYVARDEAGGMQGIGVVALIEGRMDGFAIGCFHITEKFRLHPSSRWVHRKALFVIDTMLLMTPRIYATADPEIPGAERWLRRLGFEPHGEDEWLRSRNVVRSNINDHHGDNVGGQRLRVVHDGALSGRSDAAGCGSERSQP